MREHLMISVGAERGWRSGKGQNSKFRNSSLGQVCSNGAGEWLGRL